MQNRQNARTDGRIVLAFGEVTGHCHEVMTAVTDLPPDFETAQFFDEPDGRRMLLLLQPCVLRHAEHAPIALDPTRPVQARQGDVLLLPQGPGCWEVIRQREAKRTAIRQVAD